MAGSNTNLDQQINQSAWDNYFEKLTDQIQSSVHSLVNPWAKSSVEAFGLSAMQGVAGYQGLKANSDAQIRRDIIKQSGMTPSQLKQYQGYLKTRTKNDSWYDGTSKSFYDDISTSAGAIRQDIEANERRQNPDQKHRFTTEDFQDIIDRIDDETSYFNSDEKTQKIKDILKQQGFDEGSQARFHEYLNQKISNDGWFDGNTESFYEDILKESFSIEKDKEDYVSQREKELGFEKNALKDKENYKKDYEKVQKEYDDFYNKTEDFQNEQNASIDTAQEKMIKDYAVSNNLVDQGIGQAQEYAASPSVVNQAVQANLADNTRNDILERQANRSRYGSGLSDPNQRQMDDRLGLARSIAGMRTQEQQGRVAHLQGALSQGASQKAGIAGNQHAGTLSGINSKNSSQGLLFNALGSKSQLALGKMQSLYGANTGADNEALRRMQYLEGQEFRKTEPLRQAQRNIYASNQMKFGGAAALGGAAMIGGGALTGNPALIKGGVSVGTWGVNAGMVGMQNRASADRKTGGYYGNQDYGYAPSSTYANKPILYPGVSKEAAGNLGNAAKSVLPDSIREKLDAAYAADAQKAKDAKEKKVSDKSK